MQDARPSKRQKELLSFVEGFITGHGYGPSYREIMRALGYKSVSTVATHLNGLITKGYLRKRDRSARSLEVVSSASLTTLPAEENPHVRWLQEKAEQWKLLGKTTEADVLERAIAVITHETG